jgi:hypothetical protein
MLSDVQAVRLALSSIIPAMRGYPTNLFITNQDVANFITSPAIMLGYREQINELKRWYSYYKDIAVNLLTNSHSYYNRACELARQGLDSQISYDSGTFSLSGENLSGENNG